MRREILVKVLNIFLSVLKITVFIALEALVALGGYLIWQKLPTSVDVGYPVSGFLSVIRDNLWFLISLILVNLIFWKVIERWRLPKFCGYKSLILKTIIAILLGVVWLAITFCLLFGSQIFGLVNSLTLNKSSIIFLKFMIWGKLSSAFMQEFAVRGYIYKYLETKYSYKAAIIFTSIIFGMWHMGKLLYGPLAFINVFLLGLLLAVIRWRSGSLWVTAIVHYVWNAVFLMMDIVGGGSSLWLGVGYDAIVTTAVRGLGLDQGLLYTVSTLVLTLILIFGIRRKSKVEQKQKV